VKTPNAGFWYLSGRVLNCCSAPNLFSKRARNAITNGQATAHSVRRPWTFFGEVNFPFVQIAVDRYSRMRTPTRLPKGIFLKRRGVSKEARLALVVNAGVQRLSRVCSR
jgi:hypothetical protein